MKPVHLLSFLVLMFSSCPLEAQKPLKDMTAQELTQARTRAVAAGSTGEAAVFDMAIKLKAELDAAVRAEDYDKAAVLSEKLKALRLPPPVADKLKELQAEIDKAVANEDYVKAESLKKEKLAFLNKQAGSEPKAVNSSSGLSSAPSPGASSGTGPAILAGNKGSSSGLSKNDIYGPSATWMGLDFSLFYFVSSKKTGEEQKHLKYIAAWQAGFSKKIPEKKLADWLGKSVFHSDRGAEPLYSQNLSRQWIVNTSRSLSADQVQAHLQTYSSSHHGLGLVFLPGSFDETAGELSLYAVWFDLDTRTIIHMQEVPVKAGPSSMTARWLNGLYAATKKYVDQHYKKRN